MQRIALLPVIATLVLTGCATTQVEKPTPVTHGSQPRAPYAKSRHPRYVHRPLPPLPPPLPRPTPQPQPQRRYAIDTSGLIPPGGVARGRWSAIVVHHSAGDDDTVESMDRFHRNVRHWSNGLGYDFVIGNGVKTVDGKIYVGQRWRRQIDGAHCHNAAGRYFGTWRPDNFFNGHGIGICLIGNFEHSTPTPRQMASLEELARFLCTELGIPPSNIYGHGQITGRTACPGVGLKGRLASVRQAIAREVASGAGSGASRRDDHVAARGGL